MSRGRALTAPAPGTAESRALQVLLFLVAHGALDPVLAPFPYLHGGGDGPICVCPIGEESASVSCHGGVGGDGNASGHDYSGDVNGLDFALTGIAVFVKAEWVTAFFRWNRGSFVEERRACLSEIRGGLRLLSLIGPGIPNVLHFLGSYYMRQENIRCVKYI